MAWKKIITEDQIDDSPVNGVTDEAISSNWAFDHDADTGAHHAQAHKDEHDPQDGGDALDCAAVGAISEAASAEGTAHSFARSDHNHQHTAALHQNGGGAEISVTGLNGLLADDQHVLDAEVLAVAAALAHKDRHDPQDGADALDCAATGAISEAASAEGTAHSFARSDHNHQHTAALHENGGGAEISATGLSGLLADDQHVLDAEVLAVAAAVAHENTHIKGGTDDIDAALDARAIGLANQGDIVYHSATANTLAALAPGASSGLALLTGGAAANPSWGAPAPAAHASTHDAGGSDQVHSIADDDDDTKVQVEEGADEDMVRMDVGGTEAFLLSDVGILTLAKQSAASAYLATTNQTIRDAIQTQVKLNAENFDIQNEFDSSVKTGTADATEANKLHDADGGFAAGDVGKMVWNTTDDTYTTVSAYVDSGELTLTDDIMVDGEGYELFSSRFTATEAGTYIAVGILTYPGAQANSQNSSSVFKNGASVGWVRCQAAFTDWFNAFATAVVTLAANDYLELYAYQNTGIVRDLQFGAENVTFSIIKLT